MLTEIQSRAARIMAGNRSTGGYFAGGAVLNQNCGRLSDDPDLFSDTAEAILDVVDPVNRPKNMALVDGFRIFRKAFPVSRVELPRSLDYWH